MKACFPDRYLEFSGENEDILFLFFWRWVDNMQGRISRRREQHSQKHGHRAARLALRATRKTIVVNVRHELENGHTEAGWNPMVKDGALEFRCFP